VILSLFEQVTEYIKEVYANNQCYIAIKLDLKAITQLNLDIDSNKYVCTL
jgi:hypothetical protein